MDTELLYKTYFQYFRIILFDLDGTIYEEKEYLFAAYRNISLDVENKFGISSKLIFKYLCKEFDNNGRKYLFNKFISKFGIPESYLNEAIVILRKIKFIPKIPCYSEIFALIKFLIDKNKKIFIVTNGNIEQQKNKIENIEFGDLLKGIKIIYADEYIRKPDKAVFNYLISNFGAETNNSVMVGDTNNDEEFATASGIKFIHIKELRKC